jgi:uncharacterized protein
MSSIDAHVNLGLGRHLQLAPDDLLVLMDEADVGAAVACPVDRCLAVDNREGNDSILDAVGAHPDRLAGMATANPWFGATAVGEVRRALDAGLVGLVLHPGYQGFRLNDTVVDPLLEVAAEFDVPVYAHTGTPAIAEPLQLVDLAGRFPTVPFIMGHAGASDYYMDAVRALEFADNLWLETSRNGPGNFAAFEGAGLMGRLVFGSGAPEYIPAVELEVFRDAIADPGVQRAVLHDNAQALFKGRLPR